MTRHLSCSLQNWREGRWWTIVTNSFTHFNLWYLSASMSSLSSVGPSTIAIFGAPAFGCIWIVGAAVCGLATLRWDLLQQPDVDASHQAESGEMAGLEANGTEAGLATGCIRASGSIYALTTAIACKFPHAMVTMLCIPAMMPVSVANTGLAVFSAICAWAGCFPQFGQVGHLGGMAAGLFTYFSSMLPKMLWHVRKGLS